MTGEPEHHHISALAAPHHHRAEIVFGLAAFILALFLATNIPAQTEWAKGVPFVKQPAFWPVVAITTMTIFGALELWFSWRRNRQASSDGTFAEIAVWLRAMEYVVWFMAYVWLVPLTGYLPTTLVFTAALTLRLGYRSAKIFLAALLTGAVTVIVFKSLLGVRIPGGAVYEYLPPALRNFMILYL
ncbi:tripartite tricarboxylate transporter TctB family protein [Chelativorans alearense]|uniref:tripartite tricarboxylate transporter TctB family protein n=1 Tax=Chelativorans alearense TaxID=2681495 RepID=UPI0013D6C168|nr:tripartite tricarboxylate transporter TctB family protein [Chelativorans alearense]